MTTTQADAPVDGATPRAPVPPGLVDVPLPPAMAARASDLGAAGVVFCLGPVEGS